MQQVYATAGLSGVRRFMVDQITNPQLDFDVLLKMAFFRAVLYGAAGRLDEAFDCLDQAIAYRDPALVHLAVAPDWDSLRGDPRFAERLRSMALPSIAHDNIVPKTVAEVAGGGVLPHPPLSSISDARR